MVFLRDCEFKIWDDGKSLQMDERLKYGAVSIAEMDGFVGNGSADDIIPVKAAIAKAISEGKGAIIRPAGCNVGISEPVFLGFAADQTNPAFSLALLTPGGHGNHNAQGGIWKPQFTDDVAIKVGPGQMMMVVNQCVRWDDIMGQYRALQDEDSVSYAVAAESGGCSGFQFVNCHAYGGYTMFSVGSFGAGSLADSGLFENCSGENIVYGYKLANSQAYIQTIRNNRVNAKNILFAGFGHNVNIDGGNYSGVSSRAKQYSITNVSSLTAVPTSFGFCYDFTAEVTNEDSDLASGLVHDDGVLNDAQFGLIPLIVTGYNAGTNVLSLRTEATWSLFHGQGTDLTGASYNLEARIQAATTLGLGERLTPFTGTGINQPGTIHLENGSGYTRFFHASAGFDGGTTFSSFANVHANYDVAFPEDTDATSRTVKQRLQRSHPFILLEQGGVKLEGFRLSQLTTNGGPLIIAARGARSLYVKDCIAWLAPTMRNCVGQNEFTYNFEGPPSALGMGEWAAPVPFAPIGSSSTETLYRTIGWNRTEHWGLLPAFDRSPRLTPSQVTTLTGSLPTFTTGSNIEYPLLCGGVNYSVGTPVATDSNILLIKSKHKFYSLGQDLTTTNITNLAWSFYGKTRKLVVNAEAFERLFPGLGIFLTHASIGGGTPFECLITAANKADLCLEVSAVSGWFLPGTAGTQYTGTTIGQAPYVLKTLTGA